MKFKSMITEESELTVGRELWHVYGHLDRSASKVTIMTPIMDAEHTGYRYVKAQRIAYGNMPYMADMFLGDVGIGETAHNMNRLFETEEDALSFYDSAECAQYRSYHSLNAWDEDLED
jgi:hypothetical protein